MGRLPMTGRIVVVLVAAVLCWLATTSTAQAHERLTASEPAADAVLAAVPPRVLLTFSGNVVDPAPTLVLLDASGAQVPGDEPVVEGATVALPLPEGLPNGAYTVQWGIVSSDGDPVSGDLAFTVAAPVTAAPAPSSTTPAPTSAAAGTSVRPEGVQDIGNSSVGPWLVGGAAALALVVAGLAVRRGRTRR